MRNLLLVLIATAVAFLVAEVLLRTFFPIGYMAPPESIPSDTWRELLHRRSSIPGLAYELAPNKKKYSQGAMVRTNSSPSLDNTLPLSRRLGEGGWVLAFESDPDNHRILIRNLERNSAIGGREMLSAI